MVLLIIILSRLMAFALKVTLLVVDGVWLLTTLSGPILGGA